MSVKKKVQLLFESRIFKSQFFVLVDTVLSWHYGIGFGKHWAERILGRGKAAKLLKGSWVVQKLEIPQLVV